MLNSTDVAAFEQQGYLILREAVAPQVHTAAREAAEALLTSDRTRGRDRSSDGKDGFRGVVDMDQAFLPLVSVPAVLQTAVALLGANLHLMSSHLIALPSLLPASRRTIRVPERHGWHRDMGAATRDLGTEQVPRLAIKAATFLTAPGPDTGTTMVLPGSHRNPGAIEVPEGQIDPPGAVSPRLGPRDVLLFENRTWHAGGLNTSGHTRLAVMMQYGYRWLAPLDDPPQNLDLRSLSPIENQLLSGHYDRNTDGSIAPEGSGADPLRRWAEHPPA
ncbi:hypothetical protein GCM10007147_40230 [Nocardiopsis kunsanensis]|uniref:Phytanoyl-CoA dioxygenase n=1 Tax=Nocardiopsis kunsanensis TaxID=141693 RepID=A0A918XJ36_9ACTN|nr:phytanoyl-CoA dioxygenase family protein [Nocardiopsis kunsanensis]GHD34506.1 hypothetical protein GCM10007147_40230 [Nocardiopsis kunsanensis]